MKQLTGAAVAALMLLSGCSTIGTNQGNGYPIEHVEKSRYPGGVTITYEPPEFLAEREDDAATLAKRSARASPFPGGQIIVKLHALSLEAARGSHLEMIVERDGVELLRSTGSRSTPNLPDLYDQWWSVSVIGLKEPVLDAPIDVYVIHTLYESRDHFRIHPKPE